MCSHATPFNMALWLCPEITNSVINRPTRARYEFLYSFLVVTLGCHISISSSTKNELKMSSGQLLPRVAVQVKINRVQVQSSLIYHNMLDVDFQVSYGKAIKLTCSSYFEFLFFPCIGCHFSGLGLK